MNPVQQQRLEQRFKLYDTDHDGKVSRKDLEREAERIVDALAEPADSPRARALLHSYPQLWDYLAVEANVPNDGEMDVDQFVAVVDSAVLSNGAAGYGRVLRPTIRSIVDLCDIDGDGQVDKDEFQKWINAIGGSIDAEDAFRKVDADNSGTLSVDELVAAVGRYHAGELDAPLLGV